VIVAVAAIVLGLALMVLSGLRERRARQQEIDELLNILPLPAPRPAQEPSSSPVVEGAVGLAARMVERVDPGGGMAAALERARIPLRPGEYVIITGAAGLALAALLVSATGVVAFGMVGLLVAAGGAGFVVRSRTARRRKAFERQLPGALTLIASSLAAGHTFLRAIQMMCDESDPPLSEEFRRVVSETRLGDTVVDALGRMAARLQVRDLDWVVQAIRIQQTVGGRLADLLHTLADFIRARDEVRREVQVLTAEGRMSAWILSGLVPLLLLAMQLLNPDYIRPMYSGAGLIMLGMAGAMVAFGTFLIFRMVKIEV
jgi:tight adherence protein B